MAPTFMQNAKGNFKHKWCCLKLRIGNYGCKDFFYTKQYLTKVNFDYTHQIKNYPNVQEN